MARRSRQDEPGRWHHVMNRAIARRTLFEDRTDVRYFLSRLAREVRAGRLEMQAWSVMGTHFHLLVRSPRGELSQAMRRAQSEYVCHFNRRHRRDGTLIRGRFLSKPVTTERHRRVLVAYIDQNPVVAGMSAEDPGDQRKAIPMASENSLPPVTRYQACQYQVSPAKMSVALLPGPGDDRPGRGPGPGMGR